MASVSAAGSSLCPTCSRAYGEAADALERANSLLRAALEATADGILVVDLEGRTIAHNTRFLQMWGIAPEATARGDDEELRRSVADRLEDPEGFGARVEALYAAPEAVGDDTIRLRDGRVFERFSHPQRLEGKVVGRVWSFRDATARLRTEEELRSRERQLAASEQALQAANEALEARVAERTAELAETNRALEEEIAERTRAEAELRRSEEHFRTLIENGSDLIIGVSPEGRTTYLSPSAERLLGWPPEERLGRSSFEMIHPEDVPEAAARRREAIDHPGRAVSVDFRYRHRDGGWRVFEAFIRTLLPGSAEGGLVVNARDVTERRQGQDALARAKEEAERAREAAEQANRAKSEFLSRMSHELRTPMNSILGFAQLLEKRTLADDQSRAVGHILKAGRHLLNLINEVLDIARIEANRHHLSLEPVRLDAAVAEAVNLIRPLAAQHGCSVDDPGPLPHGYVMADRQRLAQVLLNLLSNAVKYNRPGGRVRVAVEPDPSPANGGSPAAWRIEVHDTGRGIPAERMEELFVPFSRLGADAWEVEGTGLGLALSQRLVEAMRGSLEVRSTVGEGSTFTVRLDGAESPLDRLGSRAAAPGARGAPSPARPATLLYVEDNLANLTLVETILAGRPEITLVPALQGRLGLDLACQHAPDLILLDLHLPDIPGDEVLARLRATPATRRIPVVVISADATPRRIQRLRDAGVAAYLTKPIDVDEFLETVDRVLEAREA